MTGFAGRFLDSTNISAFFTFPKTLRARLIKIAPERDRIYMIMSGSRFAGQQLSTFPSRVATEPLQTGGRGEKYLAFDEQFDAEAPSSGWPTTGADGENRLEDFDWDDRGLTYLAHLVYGWGILDQNLQVVYTTTTPIAAPAAIVSFRNGTSYYAVVSDGSTSALFNVTNATAPFAVRALSPFSKYAKSVDGRLAINFDSNLVIHTPASLANNTAPVTTFAHAITSTFKDVTTDGVNFYALENGASADTIHIIKPFGGTYSDVAQVTAPAGGTSIAYGAGSIAVTRWGAIKTVALYRVDAAGLTLLNDTYFSNTFFTSGATRLLLDAEPIFVNGQSYLVLADFGLGDVFTLAPQPQLSIAKQFAPQSIVASATSQLTVTITNPNPTPVSSFSLTDTYPASVVNTSNVAVSNTCGGTFTGVTGSGSFSISGASLAASANCAVSVNVTSNAPGTYGNTIPAGAIVSTENTNSAASASLTVTPLQAPAVTKTFSPSTARPGAPVSLVITLSNPNANPIIGVAFTDNYPANLINATPSNSATTCGGSVTAVSGGTSLAFSGGTIPAGSTCSVSVDVIATAAGTIVNSLPAGAVTSTNAFASSATAAATMTSGIPGAPSLSAWGLTALASLLAIAAVTRMRV